MRDCLPKYLGTYVILIVMLIHSLVVYEKILVVYEKISMIPFLNSITESNESFALLLLALFNISVIINRFFFKKFKYTSKSLANCQRQCLFFILNMFNDHRLRRLYLFTFINNKKYFMTL